MRLCRNADGAISHTHAHHVKHACESFKSVCPVQDDENYDTNTLLAIPRVIYEKVSGR